MRQNKASDIAQEAFSVVTYKFGLLPQDALRIAVSGYLYHHENQELADFLDNQDLWDEVLCLHKRGEVDLSLAV